MFCFVIFYSSTAGRWTVLEKQSFQQAIEARTDEWRGLEAASAVSACGAQGRPPAHPLCRGWRRIAYPGSRRRFRALRCPAC